MGVARPVGRARPPDLGQARPCCFSHAWATVAGDSFWGPVTNRFSFEICAVVSLADKVLRAWATPAESADVRMTGMMWSAGSRCLLSVRTTKWSDTTVPSLENSSTTWTSPFFMAATLSGPASSRDGDPWSPSTPCRSGMDHSRSLSVPSHLKGWVPVDPGLDGDVGDRLTPFAVEVPLGSSMRTALAEMLQRDVSWVRSPKTVATLACSPPTACTRPCGVRSAATRSNRGRPGRPPRRHEQGMHTVIGNVDRILVLDDGRLTQQGTYDQLVADPDGTFGRLVHRQGL